MAALGGYQFYLEAGKRILGGYLDASRSAVAIDFQTFKDMQSPFSTAALFSLITVKDLASLYGDMASGTWIDELMSLGIELEEATRGAMPYYNSRRFEVPGATEQMRGLRLQLNSEAVLTHRGLSRKVLIRDISQGGLGIEGVDTMKVGSTITLQLPTGRQLAGEVCWQEGARAGISLSERLPLSDPLMCA